MGGIVPSIRRAHMQKAIGMYSILFDIAWVRHVPPLASYS